MSTVLWQHTDEDDDHVSLLDGTSERFAAIVTDQIDPDSAVSVWLTRDAALGLYRALERLLASMPAGVDDDPHGDDRLTDAQIEAVARRVEDAAQTLANDAEMIADNAQGSQLGFLAQIVQDIGHQLAALAGAVGREP